MSALREMAVMKEMDVMKDMAVLREMTVLKEMSVLTFFTWLVKQNFERGVDDERDGCVAGRSGKPLVHPNNEPGHWDLER
mmetsp:Transcript_55302/g.145876  ORF Transcript_55302/g.145876 Transcript_55302/m.145876 type:complete len:80 (+) Transcript_55302:141-380(+)|eukprot:CAMPEP_0113718862 /NCGR_PEP_ID=MMETSP0038_2-20120614/35454_1 /TAXON_ID=2898 /ORGANISM="Cryptomonas paramecium" /LENGTH=79 /DNA_ID=CAMNT_0000647089 /DNA_START=14 /DNA_END=253 /DNA_ORIENTATION=+ /assembly_acc=CAM_ASM_000170